MPARHENLGNRTLAQFAAASNPRTSRKIRGSSRGAPSVLESRAWLDQHRAPSVEAVEEEQNRLRQSKRIQESALYFLDLLDVYQIRVCAGASSISELLALIRPWAFIQTIFSGRTVCRNCRCFTVLISLVSLNTSKGLFQPDTTHDQLLSVLQASARNPLTVAVIRECPISVLEQLLPLVHREYSSPL